MPGMWSLASAELRLDVRSEGGGELSTGRDGGDTLVPNYPGINRIVPLAVLSLVATGLNEGPQTT